MVNSNGNFQIGIITYQKCHGRKAENLCTGTKNNFGMWPIIVI